jgi:hypothetical protein
MSYFWSCPRCFKDTVNGTGKQNHVLFCAIILKTAVAGKTINFTSVICKVVTWKSTSSTEFISP